MILGMNNLIFNDEHYLQIHGTAMGTRMAPSYANLFMAKFEQAIQNAPFKPFVWWRYIDDIFMVWTEGQDNLETFINYLNSIHPTIKFIHEFSTSYSLLRSSFSRSLMYKSNSAIIRSRQTFILNISTF